MVQFPTITFIINTSTPVNPQKRELIIQKIGDIVKLLVYVSAFKKTYWFCFSDFFSFNNTETESYNLTSGVCSEGVISKTNP